MENKKLTLGADVRACMGIQFFAEGEAFAEPETAPAGDSAAVDDPGTAGGAPDAVLGADTDPLEAIFAGMSDGEADDVFGGVEQPEDEAGEQEQPPAGAEPTFPVQIGGETVQMTAAQMAERIAAAQPPAPDQIQTLVQQQLAQNPAMQLVERKARDYGMTVDQYIETMAEQERQNEVRQIMEKTGLSQEMAQELAESRRFRAEIESERAAQAQQEQAQEQQNRMFQQFMANFPGIPAADIPADVWSQVEGGMDLTAAFATHRVKELEAENATLKQNAHVRQKAIGSATGLEQTGGRDPVLDGLNGISIS